MKNDKEALTVDDYPLAEKHPDRIRTRSGKILEDLTLAAIEADSVVLDDLRITPGALRDQAQIALAAGRPTLANGLGRASELSDVPQDVILKFYELLRPGRARSKADLLQAAEQLRRVYKAESMATFVEEAAEVYERRGLFASRY